MAGELINTPRQSPFSGGRTASTPPGITDEERKGAIMGSIFAAGANLLSGKSAPQALAAGLQGYTGTISGIGDIRQQESDEQFKLDQAAALQSKFTTTQEGLAQRHKETEAGKAQRHKETLASKRDKPVKPEMTKGQALKRRSAIIKMKKDMTAGKDVSEFQQWMLRNDPKALAKLQAPDGTIDFSKIDEEIAHLETFINPKKALRANPEGYASHVQKPWVEGTGETYADILALIGDK